MLCHLEEARVESEIHSSTTSVTSLGHVLFSFWFTKVISKDKHLEWIDGFSKNVHHA